MYMADVIQGIWVCNLAYNVPGPAAAHRLKSWGAAITKVEPPGGDPLEGYSPAWYRQLSAGQEILRLDLKSQQGRHVLQALLSGSDLLITSLRPSSLQRLGLDWDALHEAYPGLCQVAITGYPFPHQEQAGHDLTYQAKAGLLQPPHMPQTLLVDLAGGERAAAAGLALLIQRERSGIGGCAEVALAEVAEDFSMPYRFGSTLPNAIFGGGFPGYRLYRASQGWIAVAALEEAFWKKLAACLHLGLPIEKQALENAFLTKTAEEWEQWAEVENLPIACVKVDNE